MRDATTSNPSTTSVSSSPLASLFADPALQGRRLNYSPGDVIFDPETPADKVYFIHRGQVRLYHVGAQDARLVEILGPDEWFGVGAMARQATHDARAVAVVPTHLTEVSLHRFAAALSSRPEQLLDLTRQLAVKLQEARDDAARLVFDDCNARLIRTLLNFSNSAASTHRQDEVVLRITHNQLAQAVGVARETVSLALTQLRQQNLLRTGRNQLVFNPDALRRLRAPSRGQGGNPGTSKRMTHSPEIERVA